MLFVVVCLPFADFVRCLLFVVRFVVRWLLLFVVACLLSVVCLLVLMFVCACC